MQRTVAIVGAGPAGLAAAEAASACGAHVVILDEAPRPGGQIYRQAHPSLGDGEFAEAGELARKHECLARFQAIQKDIDYRPDTNVYALFGNGELHYAKGDETEVLRPDAVVIATGVREMAIPFPGWTTPGIMFAGGAQAILKSQRILPGKVAVVAGCGPLPVVVASQLLRAGCTVKALASLRPLKEMLQDPWALLNGHNIVREGLGYTWTIMRAGVERLSGYVPVRAIGTDQLEAVVLARIDKDGRIVAGTEREIACDLLAINYGFAANSELVAMAGATLRFDADTGGWLPVIDEFGRTSVPGLFVAGDGAGVRGALVAEAEGGIVGTAAASSPNEIGSSSMRASITDALARRQRHQTFQRAVRKTLRLPPELWNLVSDETVVCRCENILGRDIKSALTAGHSSLNAIKRNVRAGMGWCGGRTCLRAVAALTELHAGVPASTIMTPRPMARPVTFAALAGQKKAHTA